MRATALCCLFRCCEQGQAEQAVGVALEARRLDKLEEVITRSADAGRTLKYALKVTQNLVINREFRQQVRGGRGLGKGRVPVPAHKPPAQGPWSTHIG